MASNPHKAYDSFQSLPSTISVDVSRSRVCSVHLIVAYFTSIQQLLILKALLYQLQLQVGLNLLSLKFRKKISLITTKTVEICRSVTCLTKIVIEILPPC